MEKQIVLLPGDGIGKEVMESAREVMEVVAADFDHTFVFHEYKIGGAAIDAYGEPLPAETLAACEKADAILLGAVGGPEWENQPVHQRPEQGLLQLRKKLGLFANLRPVKLLPALAHASPLKEEVVAASDILIIRELTGGIYFGKPSERQNEGNAVVDTLHYNRYEMERIIEKGFETAMARKKHLTSVDKANVLESSRMWREIVEEKSKEYPEVKVEHVLVDACAMKLITHPNQFDTIVTENLFGDILSDEASVITGSLGMLPSASVREDGLGLYEPVHGSAPDIAGKGIANPLGMILSVSFMLRNSFGLVHEANAIERAVDEVLWQGYYTPDLDIKGGTQVSTKEMTRLIIDNLSARSISASINHMYS